MRYSIAEKSTMSCFRCTTLSNGRYRRGTAFPLHSRGCRCVEEGGAVGWMRGGVGGMGGWELGWEEGERRGVSGSL